MAGDPGDRTGIRGEREFGALIVGDADAFCECPRQVTPQPGVQRGLALLPGGPGGEHGIGGEDALQRLRESRHGASRVSADRSSGGLKGEGPLNIILVSSATARARTLTLDWRHWTAGSFALLTILVAFTLVFNYVTLRYAAASQHPWLQAIVLADQRQEAQRTQEMVQGHLNAMAVRLGELQARMMRLDGLGERLARIAGLKPQELPSLQSGQAPGLGGAESSLPAKTIGVVEFQELLSKLARDVDERSDQLGVLEALLVQTSASRKFLPSLAPILDGWYSSNFGYRIDPFNGLKTFHEGIDFPAEVGTSIVAAASGKVVFAGWQPEYGKMIEIDHGNGLVTRYAHDSQIFVNVGDLVVRGQRLAAVGSTGRSTGPHLHFEVRLNGVPQNPARFLESPG